MEHKILIIIILMNISLSVSSISAASTITAFATAGGTISPSGKLTVDARALQKFQVNAASGYLISEVIVDDVSVGAISSYTFNDVSEDHSIYATFQYSRGLQFTRAGMNPAPTTSGSLICRGGACAALGCSREPRLTRAGYIPPLQDVGTRTTEALPGPRRCHRLPWGGASARAVFRCCSTTGE